MGVLDRREEGAQTMWRVASRHHPDLVVIPNEWWSVARSGLGRVEAEQG